MRVEVAVAVVVCDYAELSRQRGQREVTRDSLRKGREQEGAPRALRELQHPHQLDDVVVRAAVLLKSQQRPAGTC